METIRKYVASGCDLAALTDEERDALRREARERAEIERRLATRAFFAGLFRRLRPGSTVRAAGKPAQASHTAGGREIAGTCPTAL